MAVVPSLKSWAVQEVVKSADLNGNFSAIRTAFNNSAVLTDTSTTIAVTHTWSASQTFNGGITGTTATFSGALRVTSGGAIITGTLEASNLVSDGTLGVAGAATFSTSIAVGNSGITSTGPSSLGGAVTITTGGLGVTGTTTLNSGLNVTGNTGFTGAVTITQTLGVTGTTSLSGTLFHSGTAVGFYGAGATTQQSVTGSRTGKDSLALQLMFCLAQLGLIANNTTP